MPPKACSGYAKKRKFCGNQHSESKRRKMNKSDEHLGSTIGKGSSASSRKIQSKPTTESSDFKEDCKEPSKESTVSGFRFVDMSILSSVFRSMPCKACHVSDLILQDQPMKRKGCTSCLRLLCCTCGWTEQFNTSAQIDRCFEVNRRFVYATRSIGCGQAAGKRFCGLMNMPPPPRPTPYALHNKALLKAVKKIALETMSDAAKEIHTLKPESEVV